MTSRQQAGAVLVAAGLINAYLPAAFDALGQQGALEPGPVGRSVIETVGRHLPDQPVGDVLSVITYLAEHSVAVLAVALGTKDTGVLIRWLDTRVGSLAKTGGRPLDVRAAEIVRDYAPALQREAPDTTAAAKAIAASDGTDLAIHLGEFAARMYALAFGPAGLARAQAALGAFTAPLLSERPS
ncbi:hypothetical protein ACIOBK_33830 [Micromonospora chokoriensis]